MYPMISYCNVAIYLLSLLNNIPSAIVQPITMNKRIKIITARICLQYFDCSEIKVFIVVLMQNIPFLNINVINNARAILGIM